MIKVNLDIQDEAYDNVMYILNSLPKNDVKINNNIKEIDPTKLSKNHFDYMSKEELIEINEMSKMIKNGDLNEFENIDK